MRRNTGILPFPGCPLKIPESSLSTMSSRVLYSSRIRKASGMLDIIFLSCKHDKSRYSIVTGKMEQGPSSSLFSSSLFSACSLSAQAANSRAGVTKGGLKFRSMSSLVDRTLSEPARYSRVWRSGFNLSRHLCNSS